MKKPCIALDVSKGESYYQGFITIDKPIGKAKPIIHSKEGFDDVMSLAKEIKKEYGDILFIFEATGIYHKGLQMYLEDNNEKYIILNPLEAAKIRKSQLRATKTDKRDCKNIASAYFLRDYRIHNKQDDVYEELRVLNRRYGFLVQQLRMLKVEFRAYLDIVYPNFDELYSDMYTQIPMAVLRNNLHPNFINKRRIETISKQLEKNTSHRKNYCDKEAIHIKDYVKNIQSGVSENSPEVLILNNLVEELRVKELEIEVHLEIMIKVANKIPLFNQLKSIPGIGENLSVRLVSELGDLSRFDNSKQLVAYAGIDPRVYQSGIISGEHLSITKKGNKHLRTLLYLSIQGLIKSRSENIITNFYNKKRQQTNPLSYKAALIACANKLLRIIFSMDRNGTMFQI